MAYLGTIRFLGNQINTEMYFNPFVLNSFAHVMKLTVTTIFLLQVLVDMIRVPDWAFEAAGQETRVMGQDAAAYHPGLYLTPAQASRLCLN